MVETLKECERKARKRHVCSYCGAYIEPGEKYDYATLAYDGDIYDWKSHKECSFVSGEIWHYVDPDDGMTEDDFRYAVQELCVCFVCPECEKWDKEADECADGCSYCIHKLYETLQKNELYLAREENHWPYWSLRLRRTERSEGE